MFTRLSILRHSPKLLSSAIHRRFAIMAKLNIEIPKLTLNDGNEIPMLGFGSGTALYKRSGQDKLDQELVKNVETAIKVGYRHLDTAESYSNEEEVGKALKNSKVPREEFFLTTKVYGSLPDVEGAFNTSLKKLGVDYVDLYLIHAPFNFKDKTEIQTAWKAMEAIKKSGKAKSIGVSNFLQSHLEAILEICEIPPAINQTEFHAYLQREKLVAWSKSKGITTAAYGPSVPITKARPGPVDNVLAALSKKYAVNEAEICLRWCIDQDIVAVTTSTKESRMSDYLRVTAFKLTPREIEDLSNAGREKHHRQFWGDKFDKDDRS